MWSAGDGGGWSPQQVGVTLEDWIWRREKRRGGDLLLAYLLPWLDSSSHCHTVA